MNWAFIVALAAAAYGLKVLGAVIIGQRSMPVRLQGVLLLIPASLLAGLITKDTLTVGQDIVIDARLAGVAVAAVATWRRMPLWFVLVTGVGTTALLRAIG